MAYLLFNLFLLFLIFIGILIVSAIWPPDSPWAPWWQTDKKTAQRMCKLAKVKKREKVYDLGSGDGTSLIIAAKEFGAVGFGIEIDPVRVLISRLKIKLAGCSSRISIKRGNFFKQDISDADVVFIYLIPKTLYRLKKKLLTELKPGTRIVTVTYKIPGGLENKKLSDEYFKTLGLKKSLKKIKDKELFLYTL